MLKQLHDELDAAVLGAYGWADAPDDATLLERLVALNARRAAEEADGTIRWLRPAYQHPAATPAAASQKLDFPEAAVGRVTAPTKRPWPADLPGQLGAVAQLLNEARAPIDASALAKQFSGKRDIAKKLPGLLAALEAVARAHKHADGKYSAT